MSCVVFIYFLYPRDTCGILVALLALFVWDMQFCVVRYIYIYIHAVYVYNIYVEIEIQIDEIDS